MRPTSIETRLSLCLEIKNTTSLAQQAKAQEVPKLWKTLNKVKNHLSEVVIAGMRITIMILLTLLEI